MPAKIFEVIAFNCTNAGFERGSDPGKRRYFENVNSDVTAG
jgi:hypothetical protein